MKTHVLAVAVLLAAAQVSRAQVRDLAELFPAKTRAYLEINSIADVVKEVRGLVKGSCLEDPPRSLEKFGDLARNSFFFADFLEVGVLLSSEGLTEISRIRGGAIACTDLTDDPGKNPAIVGVLLTGESNLPALFMRLVLSVPLAKKVGEVEGVRLYQSRDQILEKVPLDGQQPEFRESGPVMALMPGIVIAGSSTEAVGDVIRRCKGKAKGASLASVADFKNAADLRAKPGLFVHGDGEALAKLVLMTANSLKNRAPVYALEQEIPKLEDRKNLPLEAKGEIQKGKGLTGLSQELMDLAKGFHPINFNLTLKDGSAQLNGRVALDAKGKSPWAEFFSPRTIDLNMLRFMPNKGGLGIFAALPEGTGFWDKLGKAAPLLDTELSLALGKDLLKMARVGLVDAGRNDPVFLVEATDTAGAQALGEILGKRAKKATNTKGRMVALASDPKLAVEVLTGKGLGADKKMLEALKDHQQAQVLLVFSVSQMIAKAIREDAKMQGQPKSYDKKVEPAPKIEGLQELLLQGRLGEKKPEVKEPPPLESAKKLKLLAERAAKSLESLPPFVLSLSKKSDQLVLHGRQLHLQTLVPRLIDVLVEWELTSSRFGMYETELPPLPPPKKEAAK